MSSNSDDPEITMYALQLGDTFWKIANQYNTTVVEIIAVNPEIDLNNLFVGQVIKVPDSPLVRRLGFRRPYYPYQYYRPYPYNRHPDQFPYYSYPYPHPYPNRF